MRFITSLCLLAGLATVLSACSREYEPTQEITEVREATADEVNIRELDTAQRLRMERVTQAPPMAEAMPDPTATSEATPAPEPPAAASEAPAAMPSPSDYRWNMPTGWVEQPSTSMRLANFHVEGHPEAEVYFGVLPGDGGGLAANVNRWRRQMGHEPLDDEVVESLPIKPLFLKPEPKNATFVMLEGPFTGMGGETKEDYMLYGLMLVDEGSAYYVKMIGPKEVLQGELSSFQEFAQSIRSANPQLATAAPGPAPAPRAEPAPAPAEEPAPPEQPADAAAHATSAEDFDAANMHWHAPEGWEEQGPRPMRAVTYQVGEDSECYISVLGGTAGGVAANFNRWRAQMGQEPLSESEIAALDTIEIAGVASPYIEIDGDYTGMRGPTYPDYTMLGVMRPSEDRSLFIKLVGPTDEARGAVESFKEFCRSIH